MEEIALFGRICFIWHRGSNPTIPAADGFFIRPDVLGIQLLSHDWVEPAAGEAFFGCAGEGGDGDVMQIIVNGKEVDLAEQVRTIRDLLDSYQLMEKIVVVEQNSSIIERSQYENQTIADGDRIEIVHFVGGG